MPQLYTIGLYILSALLIAGGFAHFFKPRFYERMMPLWFPVHRFTVAVSGIAEIVLGVLLIVPGTQVLAAWGITALFVSFLIIHVHMLFDSEAGMGLPKWALVFRLLLQFGLIAWAWAYTQV